jgi:hypothetical protein
MLFKGPFCAYVESPFQLLQAFEYVGRKRYKGGVYYVRLTSQIVNNQQLRQVVSTLDIKQEVVWVSIGANWSTFSFLWRAITRIPFTKVFLLGDEFGKVGRLLLFLLKLKKNILLLDDGVATLSAPLKQRRRFSFFLTDDTQSLKNDFRFFHKKHILGTGQNPINIIIGSKFLDLGLCSEGAYLGCLEYILEQSKNGYPTYYIPHRGETERYLTLVSRLPGLSVRKTRLPIEFVGPELASDLVEVSGVASTALFVLPLLYPNAVIRAFLPALPFFEKRRDGFKVIYDAIKSAPLINSQEVPLCSWHKAK